MIVNGEEHDIVKPLDFAAVTDHAEYIGEMYSTMTEGAPGHDQELLQQLRGLTQDCKRGGTDVRAVGVPEEHQHRAAPEVREAT